MIIQLQPGISSKQKEKLYQTLQLISYKGTEVKTAHGTYLVCIGKNEFDIRNIGNLQGVIDVHRVNESYKLVSHKWKVKPTVLELSNGVKIGGDHFAIMAGPCSIESEEQVEKIVGHLNAKGVKIMRGGVFKPRSSPYAFRGMGIDGLKMFYRKAKEAGLLIISEVMDISQIEPMYDYVDIFQVGARNSQNFNLLDELGKVNKPVLLKRALSGTIDELLQSAEYIFLRGNEQLLLCERGIRTYETAYRNTFDINALTLLKEKTHLPVIADPSHGIGIRNHVSNIALASVLAGADGVIFEVHETPEKALSDGQQTLNFMESEKLISDLNKVWKLKENL